MAVDPQFTRRLGRLVVLRDKFDMPDECVVKMVTNSLLVDSKIVGLSEKETADIVIQLSSDKERREQTSGGLLCALLTEKEQFPKYFSMMSVMSVGDHWFSVLCSVNMVLIEVFPKLQEQCKDTLIQLFREAIRLNIPKIENVLMNLVRTVNGSCDWNSKIRLAMSITNLLNETEQRQWLLNLKAGSFIFSMLLTTLGHIISAIPYGHMDNIRNTMLNFCVFIIRNRSLDSFMLGRDLVLMLMKIAKLPLIHKLWEDMINTPSMFGIQSIDDIMFRTNQAYHATQRLAPEVVKKIDFLLNYVKPNSTDKHFEWFVNSYLKGHDADSLRAEMIRYVLYSSKEREPSGPLFEARMHFALFLIVNAQPGVETQWLKTVIWIDWLFYDPGVPIVTLELVISLMRYTLNTNTPKANSWLEYVCKSVTVIHPPSADRIRFAMRAGMKALADYYTQANQPPISVLLENPRLDRPVRDALREIWPDFVKPPTIMMQPVPVPVVVAPIEDKKNTDLEIIDDDIQVINHDKEKTEKTRKSPSPPILSSRHKVLSKEEVEKEVESSYRLLREEIKPIVGALRDAYQSEESDDSEKGEAVQRLLQQLLLNEENIDEEQLELVGQCLLGLLGRPMEIGQSLVPETTTEDALQEAFAHPLYIIFRNLCFTPINDNTTRAPMIAIIAAMRERDNTITNLMLFFSKAGSNNSYSDTSVNYNDVARACDREPNEMLAEDLQQCAFEDDRLFTFLVPFVLENFNKELGTPAEVLKVICHHIDASQLTDILGAQIREILVIFRKLEVFTSVIQSSLEWETAAQWMLWQLVSAEKIPIEWLYPVISKIRSAKHPEAAGHILLILKRLDREPPISLIRAIFGRQHSEDPFAVNCIRALIDDPDQCQRMSDHINTIMKKQLNQGDIHIVHVNSKLAKKTPTKLPLEQIFAHLNYFTQLCVSKDNKKVQELLKPCKEMFSVCQNHEKASCLRTKFKPLFDIVDLSDSNEISNSSRTLRGNRGSAVKPTKRKDDPDEDAPSKKKKNRTIVLDSDSD